MTPFIIAVAAIALILIVWFIATSNNLIAKKNRVLQCESGICVALKQRSDMIPNLVAVARTYMEHEKETLVRITELRSVTQESPNPGEIISAGNEMSRLLGQVKIQAERYPELKANENFRQLQFSIENMEDEIQAIRRTYNAAVVSYNNSVQMFPSSIVASSRGHRPAALIEVPEAERINVNVADLLGK